jgi:hypothetical protein
MEQTTTGIGHIHNTNLETYQKLAKESTNVNKELDKKYQFNF